MKKTIKLLTMAAIIATLSFTAAGCPSGGAGTSQTPRPQDSGTISLFGGTHSTTITGNLTDTEWAEAKPKVIAALEAAYATGDPAEMILNVAFNSSDVTIEIVKPSASEGWSKWKATYSQVEGAKLYLNFNMLDDGLQQSIVDAALATFNPEYGQM